MPRARLTETSVLRLKCKPKPYRVYDYGSDAIRGLEVLVQPSGTRTYRVTTKSGTKKVGRVGELTLAEARAKALELQRGAAQSVTKATFSEALEAWKKFQVTTHERVSAEATDRFVRFNCAHLLDKQLSEITEHQLRSLLEAKVEAGRKAAGNRLCAHLRTFFKWARKRKYIATDPMLDIDKPWQGKAARQGRKRDWFRGEAAEAVIRALWSNADRLGGDKGIFLKLLVLTCKRSNAVASMRWEHIDASYYWTPPEGSANKRNNPIPLPRLARRILNPRKWQGPVVPNVGIPGNITRYLKDVPDDMFLHGIRHIAATKLPELGVNPWISRWILDHTTFEDVHELYYMHGDYKADVAAGLEKWATWIESLVSPSEAVMLIAGPFQQYP